MKYFDRIKYYNLSFLLEKRTPRDETVFKVLVVFLRRFDLIFLTLDPQSEVYDRSLAKHLVSLYYHQKDVDKEEYMVGICDLDFTITCCLQALFFNF